MQYLRLSVLKDTHMNIKHTTLALLTSLGLAACGGGIGLGFGLGNAGGGINFGTGISIPLGGWGAGNDPAKSGINIVHEEVVSYFAPASQQFAASERPINGGFYRKLLGKQGKNTWLVQDFYYDNERKYNEPMLLGTNEAYRFDALPATGTFYTYHANGQLQSKRVLEQRRLVSLERWDEHGNSIR